MKYALLVLLGVAALSIAGSAMATEVGTGVCVNAQAAVDVILTATSEGPPFSSLTPVAVTDAAFTC
jgi:hypothetical protein